MEDLSTRTKIVNPIREWKLPEPLEHGDAPSGASPSASKPTVISVVTGFAMPKGLGLPDPISVPPNQHPLGVEDGRGKLGPHLKLLLKMVEDRPRAKIKDFYLILKDRGYHGSYDLVKKKIHAFRRELGRQANATFLSTESPHAQVEMAKLVLKGPDREIKAHLFTMVLGNSGRFYAELIEGCEMGSFLQCHQNAFAHFGGVPSGIFYDPYESPAMRRLVGGVPFHLPVVDCGHHYGYATQPTPVFAPWMKGRLKRPGKVLKKLFFPGYELVSLEKANADMLAWMAALGQKNPILDRKDRGLKERLGVLPLVGFNFRGRRQYLRLRA